MGVRGLGCCVTKKEVGDTATDYQFFLVVPPDSSRGLCVSVPRSVFSLTHEIPSP
jgi:hypothetical protein